MARRIECPDCGETVELNESNIIPTHDNAPPCRSVCRASGADATHFVAMVDKTAAQAVAAEREEIKKMLEEHVQELVSYAQGSDPEVQITTAVEVHTLRAVIKRINERSTTAHEKRVISAGMFASSGTARDGAK